jgi:hypothetical protein
VEAIVKGQVVDGCTDGQPALETGRYHAILGGVMHGLETDGHGVLARPAVRRHLDHRVGHAAQEDVVAVMVRVLVAGAHQTRGLAPFVQLGVAAVDLPVGAVALVQVLELVRRARHDVPAEAVVVGVAALAVLAVQVDVDVEALLLLGSNLLVKQVRQRHGEGLGLDPDRIPLAAHDSTVLEVGALAFELGEPGVARVEALLAASVVVSSEVDLVGSALGLAPVVGVAEPAAVGLDALLAAQNLPLAGERVTVALSDPYMAISVEVCHAARAGDWPVSLGAFARPLTHGVALRFAAVVGLRAR